MSNQPIPPASSSSASSSALPDPQELFPGGWKRFWLPALFVAALFAAVFFRRPAKQAKASWTLRGYIFGTTYMIKVRPKRSFKMTRIALQRQIDQTLKKVDMQMSTYKKKSELSRFNRSKNTKAVKVSKPFFQVLRISKNIYQMTGGAFDITIGPIVNLWGFGPAKYLKQPTEKAIANAKKRVGFGHLSLDASNQTIRKDLADLYVDLSAIAKGYGVDAAGWTLERAGISDYLVEIGGEVRARGHRLRGKAWRIGIERPSSRNAAREIEFAVPLQDMSMATSGNYRNYIMVDGRRVSHLIDGRTGMPVSNHLASVSVVHKDCATADALATAFFVLGEKRGLQLAERKKLAVLFLMPKGKSFVSVMTSSFRSLLDKSKKKTQSTKEGRSH